MTNIDVRDLGLAAKMGMEPFRAKDIVVYEDFDIDFNWYRIGVEWRLDEWVFPCKIYIDRDNILDSPLSEFQKVFDEILNYYRFEIPTIPMFIDGTPTHPHIILGDN